MRLVIQDDDWQVFDSGDAASSETFRAELLAEIPRGHELFEADLELIARRFAQDDVLVRAAGRDGCAAVHLTWTGSKEMLPYPRTQWYESIEVAMEALEDS
jgi:hypothetical protein